MTFEELQKANEQIRTTNIKGKEYAEVNQRIKAFRMVFPEGFICTEIVSIENGVCVMRAHVGYNLPEGDPVIIGEGTAYEKETSSYINKTSYIENCETSAVGRALGMAGFGIDTSVASYEEVANAINNQAEGPQNAQKRAKAQKTENHTPEPEKPSETANTAHREHIGAKEWDVLKLMCVEKGINPEEVLHRYGFDPKKPSSVTRGAYDDMVKTIAEGRMS